jgi:hypothetical protein
VAQMSWLFWQDGSGARRASDGATGRGIGGRGVFSAGALIESSAKRCCCGRHTYTESHDQNARAHWRDPREMMLICGHLLEVVLGFIGQMGNAGADIVVDAGCCPAVIFSYAEFRAAARGLTAIGRTPNTVAGLAAYRTPDRNSSSSISR